jgi:hypothetical protein
MATKRSKRVVDTGFEILDATPEMRVGSPSPEDKIETDKDREFLDEKLASALEIRIKTITGASLGQWPAEIVKITSDSDGLHLSMLLPFPILRPSPVLGRWPPSRREQNQLRNSFAEFLLTETSQRDVASFFHQKLASFLIELKCPKKLSLIILEWLNSIVQRKLAGRPKRIITHDMRRRIKTEGRFILNVIRAMKNQVELWQKKNKSLEDSTILTRLRKKYLRSSYAGMIQHFWNIRDELPRRRHHANTLDAAAFSEDASLEGNKERQCKISEPGEWSMIDIAAKVTQAHLLKETGKQIAQSKIRTLIKK